MDKTEPEGFSTDSFYEIQKELQKAVDEGKLSGKDPSIQKLVLDLLEKDINIEFVKEHGSEISSVINELTDLSLSETKIQNLFHTTFLTTSSLEKDQRPVSVELLFDLDAPDFNGVILQDFNAAIQNEHTVITTRSLFRAAKIEEDRPFSLEEIQRRDGQLSKLKNRYDIWTDGPFLIFIPKNLGEDLTEKKRLENLDLKASDLQKISLEKAWEQVDEKPTLDRFQKLFSDDPLHNKLIYLAGHGGKEHLAGIHKKDYPGFLKWIEKERCQGLLITSCYSGGESALLHLSKEENIREDSVKSVSFPVFINSMGDFSTVAVQKNVRNFFLNLTDLLSSPGGTTIPRLRKLLQEEEAGQEKSPRNLMQAYFPYAGDSPGGFRPVGEGGESYPLTYGRFRKEQIESGKIQVDDQEFLELSPLIIDCPIEFEKKDPLIFSMIPGQSYHFLSSIHLSKKAPKEFIFDHVQFYENAIIGVEKTFFVSSLRSDKEKIDQVVMSLKSKECCYLQNNQYYFMNLQQKETSPIPISSFQFALFLKKALHQSEPESHAVRLATGGQQKKEDVINQLVKDWSDQTTSGIYQDLFSMDVKKISFEDLQKMMGSWSLTESESISLVCYLLSQNEELAISLFETLKISPDKNDEKGVPLIIHAAKNGRHPFVKLLLKKKVHLNAEDPVDLKTAFAIALQQKDEKLANLFLEQENIDLVAKDQEGNVAFSYALFDAEILRKCFRKNPNLPLNAEITTLKWKQIDLLSLSTKIGTIETMKVLLEAGLNPNGVNGKNIPLKEAILNQNPEKISLLLNNNADPFQKNDEGVSPISEAMQKSSFSIVKQLLEKKKLMTNEEKMDCFFAAVSSAEESKIQFTFEMNPLFSHLTKEQEKQLEEGLGRLLSFGRKDLIKKIIDNLGTNAENVIIRFCLDKAPDQLESFMKKEWNLSLLIEQVLRKKNLPRELTDRILEKAVNLGADLNRTASKLGDLPLKIAFQKEDINLAKYLLEKGADPRLFPDEILQTKDLSLIQLAFQKGLNLSSWDKPSAIHQVVQFDLYKEEVQQIFRWLVEQGSNLTEPYLEKTPFENVISSGNFSLYQFCLEHEPKILAGNLDRLLSFAVESGTIEKERVAKDLIEKGANLNAKDLKDYCTIFSKIVRFGSFDFISFCVDKGAITNPENPSLRLFPLQAAAMSKHQDAEKTFQYLVEKGAKVNERGLQNFSPFLVALHQGNVSLVQFCFTQGASLRPNEVEKAFLFSLRYKNRELVDELLKHGYSFSLKTWEENRTIELLKNTYVSGGFSMLETALSFSPPEEAVKNLGSILQKDLLLHDDLETFHLLEKKEAEFDFEKMKELWKDHPESYKVMIDILDRLEKKDCLHFLKNNLKECVQAQNVELLKYALDQGIDPNVFIEDTWREEKPLLFEAIHMKNSEMVKTILDANPDLSLKHQKQTPLQYAKSLNNEMIIRLIRDKLRS